MSMKKKLGAQLTEGVRQVKTQREPAPVAAPHVEAETPATPPLADSLVAKLVAQLPTPQAKTNLNIRHPKRVWPD